MAFLSVPVHYGDDSNLLRQRRSTLRQSIVAILADQPTGQLVNTEHSSVLTNLLLVLNIYR